MDLRLTCFAGAIGTRVTLIGRICTVFFQNAVPQTLIKIAADSLIKSICESAAKYYACQPVLF